MLNLIQESERLVSMCITLMHANNSNNNKLHFIAFSLQRRLKENGELTSFASTGNLLCSSGIAHIAICNV